MRKKPALFLITLVFQAMQLASQTPEPPGIVAVAMDAPVVAGQWHSNLETAKAKAEDLGLPLLVLWGTSACKYCRKLAAELVQPEARAYLAGRGLIMVYEKTDANPPTAVKQWVGKGRFPLARLTWRLAGRVIVDQRWERPASFAEFQAGIENQLGSYLSPQR